MHNFIIGFIFSLVQAHCQIRSIQDSDLNDDFPLDIAYL